MIQSALFFILGVLVTVFVLVLLGPSVWRRASFLARRQVQAELPVTLAEIRADKDGLRAEYAVTISRLEQLLKLERRKVAEQAVEIARQQDAFKHLSSIEEQSDTSRKEEAQPVAALAVQEVGKGMAEIPQTEPEAGPDSYSAVEGLADILRSEISRGEAENVRSTNMKRPVPSDMHKMLEQLIGELSQAQTRLESGTQSDRAVVRQNAGLREKMTNLAAYMVVATAEKEGEGSPIRALLEAADKSATAGEVSKSLAERINDLRRD
ncbi:hypothetical protein AAIB41_06700 [Brucella sp. BE17]|uniref:hypothetical protein n=1 Tax=Brucella sp. BE17 TaxID=3142977 RepID=UPI0031B9EB56